MQRRELLWGGAAAGIATVAGRAFAQTANEKLIAWTDLPPPVPEPLQNVVKGITRWEDLDTWITPNDKWFSIAHYNRPQIDAKTYRLDIGGLVAKPAALTLDQLKALPRKETTSTDRMFGEQWPAIRSEYDRQRHMGWGVAGRRAASGGYQGWRHRGGVLRRR